mgnify:CR=1 FL=1
MILFFALCFVGVAIAGATAFVIFWPLTLVHVRDRHAGTSADSRRGRAGDPRHLPATRVRVNRATPDTSLSGLATPARIALWTIIFGLSMAALLWLVAEVMS